MLAVLPAALPAPAIAGQIYGTILADGQPLRNASVIMQCGSARDAQTTSPSGTYRLFVKADGQCTMTIGGAMVDKPVFLYASPTRYNFIGTNNHYRRQ